MATTTNITTTYAGQFADEIIRRMLLQAVTLAGNGVRLQEGIKKSWTISRLTSTGIIAARDCDFTPIGTVNLDERALTPKDLQVNLQLCKDDFRATQFAESMGAGRNNEMLAPQVRAAMIAEIGAKVAEAIEQDMWMGDGTGTTIQGLWERSNGDANTVKVTGVAGGITDANVLAELGKVYDAIPAALLSTSDITIYVGPKVFRAYQVALSGFGASGLGAAGYLNQGTVGMKPMNYNGVRIFPTLGLDGVNNSSMLAAQSSNLWFGTDLATDMTDVKVLDQSMVDGSNNVNFVAQWAADTNYGFSEEVVCYQPGA